MRVELLAVGDELLLGARVNAHAAWLGQRLAEVGIDVVASVAVGDECAAITAELAQGAQGVQGQRRADAIVVTGGLGSTGDDLTREALAQAAGVRVCRDRQVERALREHYAELGVPDRSAALRQADVPEGATVLANERGTAPGLRLELGETVVYALPGVPAEMEHMFTASVLPDLLARAGTSSATVSRTVHTAATWESSVAERLAGLERELAADANVDVALAYLASPGQVGVRVTGRAATREAATALVTPVEERVRELLGATVYGTDGDSLEHVVHQLLARRGATVAVAESLTGGLVAERLTAVPGASVTFRGGVVAYTPETKVILLGVPEAVLRVEGAVHPEVAYAMAAGARDRLGATYGLGLTGVAGPGPQQGHPAGILHVAVAGQGDDRAERSPRLPGDRARNREHAAVHVLDLLRRHMLELDPLPGWEE